MPQDDETQDPPDTRAAPAPRRDRSRHGFRDYFTIPPPMKRLFDKFPLITYDANDLPTSSPSRRPRGGQAEQDPLLYVFSTREDAREGRPSFNPTCLRWQAYLRFNGIQFELVVSNNHASPSGALPFLLPRPQSQASSADPVAPIASGKIEKWVGTQENAHQEPYNLRHDAYISLLDHRIRSAWLHTLYLEPRNAAVLHHLYVEPCSSNVFVSATISHQLRTAAEAEITKATGSIDVASLYGEADKAFDALATLLGEDRWFFAAEQPGLFDASVFAYTRQLLSEEMGWEADVLVRAVKQRENLVEHCHRISEVYFSRS